MNTVVMLLLFIFLTPLAFATTNDSVICTQQYVICASAPCMPIPGNMRSALCSCKVVTTGKYVTYGGNCNTDSCKAILWSGATNKAFLQGSQALIDFLKIKKLPYQCCD